MDPAALPVTDRRFVGRAEPLVRIAARLLLAEAPSADGRIDLRDRLVALPGSRAGRRLAELLLEGAEARGAALLPPEITTLGALPERFYRAELPEPDPILDAAAWRAALEGLSPDNRRRLMAVPPEADDDQGWDRMARTLRRLHREVAVGGWTFHHVAERCADEGLLFSDEERWRLLAEVQDRYREVLAEHSRRDREESRRRALAGAEAALDRPLWLVGATDLPPIVRRFLVEAVRAAPHVVLVPAPETEAAGFDELGALDAGWWEGKGADADPSRIRVVEGPAAQARATVEALAALDGGHAAEDVAVGVPDPEVLPYLVERLGDAGAPVRWAGGRPMHRASCFRLLEALADYLERREYDAFAALVRHPEMDRVLRREGAPVGEADPERPGPATASIPALADRYQALHLPARLEQGRLPKAGEWSRAPLQPFLTRVRDALEGLLEPLEGRRRLADWPGPLQTVLVRIYGDATLDRSREHERETLEVVGAVREVLQGMQALPEALDRPVAAHRAVRALLAELRGRAVPPEADRDAVELLGWLELALDDAPVMIVTGVNEPRLPEAVTADPFLPHALRSRLGLLDNRGRWARDLLNLRMVLEGRERAVLVAGRADADGNPLRLSRLLLTGSPNEVARRLLEFLGEEGSEPPEPAAPAESADPRELADPPEPTDQPDPADRSDPTVPEAAFPLPPEPVLRAPAPPEQIGVTRFRRILADPYVYALEEVLGLESVDDRAREMDGALFGTLAHEVLETWGRGDIADSHDAREIRRALEEILDASARARFGSRPLPAVRLQTEQLRARLGAFAEWQAGWRAGGWEIRDVEAAPASPGVPFDVDDVPVRLRGRIDRVDHHPERGEWLLLDYKTGDQVLPPDKTHRRGPRKTRRWVDLQLPLYLHLASALRTDEGDRLIPRDELGSVRVGYLALPRDRHMVCEHLAAWTDEELAEADETAREAVRLLRRNRFEFQRGETRAWRGSPLETLLGKGVMALYRDDEGAPDA